MRWLDRLLWLTVALAAAAAVAVPIIAVRAQDAEERSRATPANPPSTPIEREAARFALEFAGSVRDDDILRACRLTAPPAFQAYGCGTAQPRIPPGLAIPPGERLRATAVEVDGGSAHVTIPVRGAAHDYRLRRIAERWRVVDAEALETR